MVYYYEPFDFKRNPTNWASNIRINTEISSFKLVTMKF